MNEEYSDTGELDRDGIDISCCSLFLLHIKYQSFDLFSTSTRHEYLQISHALKIFHFILYIIKEALVFL